MNTELSSKLTDAIATAAQLTLAYNEIALDVETGAAPAAVRTQARKDLEAAEQRVAALRGAIAAAAAREQQSHSDAEVAAAAAQRAVIDAALRELNEVASQWDAALDGLAAQMLRLVEAEQAVSCSSFDLI